MTSPMNNDKFLSVNPDRNPTSTRHSPVKTDSNLKTENSPSIAPGPSKVPTSENIDIRRAQQFYTSEQNALRPPDGARISSNDDAQLLVTEISRQLADSPRAAVQVQAGKLNSRLLAILQIPPN